MLETSLLNTFVFVIGTCNSPSSLLKDLLRIVVSLTSLTSSREISERYEALEQRDLHAPLAVLVIQVDVERTQTRSKTVELMAIRNGPKHIISINGGLKLLQMVLELDTKRCASKDAGL